MIIVGALINNCLRKCSCFYCMTEWFFLTALTRLRNQWLQACRTILAINGKLIEHRWSLCANWATVNSAKCGKDCGTTRRLLPLKRSNLVFITHPSFFIRSSIFIYIYISPPLFFLLFILLFGFGYGTWFQVSNTTKNINKYKRKKDRSKSRILNKLYLSYKFETFKVIVIRHN